MSLLEEVGEEEEDYGQQVKWKIDFRIKKFPSAISKLTSAPYLFSPNFTYQLDFNYRARQFIIKESRSQDVYMSIPCDLLSTAWGSMDSEKAIKIICSRFKWESERIFRIVNIENLDCVFEMCSSDPSDKDPAARYLRLVSVVKIDNQHENMAKLDSPHLLSQRVSLEARDVLERLIRVNQDYKTHLQHALNMQRKDFNILN